MINLSFSNLRMIFLLHDFLEVINYFYCVKGKHEELIFMKKQQRQLAWSDVLIMFTRGLTSQIIFRDHFKSSGGNVTGDPLHEGKWASICQKNNDEP